MSDNWICSRCNAYNPPRRARCWQCKALYSGADAKIRKAKNKVIVNRAIKIAIGILTFLAVAYDLSLLFWLFAIEIDFLPAWLRFPFLWIAFLMPWTWLTRLFVTGFALFHVAGNARLSILRRATISTALVSLSFISLPIYFFLCIWPGDALLRAAPSLWALPAGAQTALIFKWPIRLAVVLGSIFYAGYALFVFIALWGSFVEGAAFQNAAGVAQALLSIHPALALAQGLAMVCQTLLIWFCFLYLLESPKTSKPGYVATGLIVQQLQLAALIVSVLIITAPNYRKVGLLARAEEGVTAPESMDPMLSYLTRYISRAHLWGEKIAFVKFFTDETKSTENE